MPIDSRSERKSVRQLAFDHYLRTGERLTEREWLRRHERKFNPYHDEIGRFTSAPGVTVSHGNRGAGMTDRPAGRAQSAKPKPATFPPGSTVILQGATRAQGVAMQAAREVSARLSGRTPPIRPAVRDLLTQIAKGEGVADDVAQRHGFASSYDVPFNYGRYAKQTKPLTRMTLKEIDDLQTRILNNPANKHDASPVGKYQIVRETLRGLKIKLNLNDDQIFDENLQDMLGYSRLEDAGLQDYLDGKISETDFQIKLSRAWASVADPRTGRPRKSNQHLGTTNEEISPLIRAIRKK